MLNRIFIGKVAFPLKPFPCFKKEDLRSCQSFNILLQLLLLLLLFFQFLGSLIIALLLLFSYNFDIENARSLTLGTREQVSFWVQIRVHI
jgi:hypothetical protein